MEENNKDAEWITNAEEKIPDKKGDYELEMYLSTDGKHTVHIIVKDPTMRHEAVKKAMELYDYVLARYGTKQAQAVKEYSKEVEKIDPATCKHEHTKVAQSKTEKNPGRWFKTCQDCKSFLGWTS